MTEGWLKLHRNILDWEWYKDKNTCRVFLHCLLNAMHSPVKYCGIDLIPGQFVTGRRKLALELNLSEKEIRTALSKLKMTNELAIKSTSKYSIITVNNWDKYQLQGQEVARQTANLSPAKGSQKTTKEECNNELMQKGNNFINASVKKSFETEYKKVFKKPPVLMKEEYTKLQEIANTVTDFEQILPKIISKLSELKFYDSGYKPTANWLLKDNNFARIANGEFDEICKANNKEWDSNDFYSN